MIANVPVIIIRNLQQIPPYSPTSQIEVRGKERYEKTKAPGVICFEIPSIREVVPGYESIFGGEYLIWCPKLGNDRREIRLPRYDKGHIVGRDRLIKRHSPYRHGAL